MATYTFNIAKGRPVELYNRVENNDPAAAQFGVHFLSATPAQATAIDVDDYAALISAGAVELNTNGWAVKALTDAELAAFPAPDDTNDRYGIAVPTWTFTPTTGTAIAAVVTYASVASPTNAQRLVVTHHDVNIVADGNPVQINAGDFFRGL